jgi:hypothetical protein
VFNVSGTKGPRVFSTWEDKGALVDAFRVVLDGKSLRYLPRWNRRVYGLSVGCDYKADLAGWIGGYGGVGVLHRGEDLIAFVEHTGDEIHVQPHALSLGADQTVWGESVLHADEELWLEEGLSWPHWVARVTYDDVIVLLRTLLAKVSSSVVVHEGQAGVVERS